MGAVIGRPLAMAGTAAVPALLPYGMDANRASIEALIAYAVKQQLIPKRPALDEVFADPAAM
jgi:4,5-dihydroxyphthalate decarboxylase